MASSPLLRTLADAVPVVTMLTALGAIHLLVGFEVAVVMGLGLIAAGEFMPDL